MKNTLQLMLAVIFAASIFTACSSSNDDNNNPTPSKGSMQAKVDGTLKKCDLSVQATYSNSTLALAGRWGGSGGGFTLTIPNYTSGAIGDFNIGGLGNTTMAIYSEGTDPNTQFSANMTMGSGKITITSMNSTVVKGTFVFDAQNTSLTTKKITEGQFEINF